MTLPAGTIPPAAIEDLMDSAMARFGPRPLQVLREVQRSLSQVPDGAIAMLSRRLALPFGQILGLVEFHSFLHRKPRGAYDVALSFNATDEMQGQGALAERLCARLGVRPGEPRSDGRVTVDFTSCIGLGDQGLAALVNGVALTHLSPERVDDIARLIEAEAPLSAWPGVYFQVESNIRRRDWLLDHPVQPGAALRKALDAPEAAWREIEASGLRGRGGAGFPTAKKWRACKEASGKSRYVVCDADEGEPGTFKDRVLLQSYLDQVLEGMTLCGALVGARQGLLYVRSEYGYLEEALLAGLEERRRLGLLGRSILGEDFEFDIEVHWGAGAYVCGEESALVESLEGHRGIPRVRPPYPVTRGYLGCPTTVNNVETFFAAAAIAVEGGEAFARMGGERSTGTKLFSVSGDCDRPGVYEYPMGVSLREVLADCGAHNPQAVQAGGPSGACVGASEFDRRLCYEDLPPSGALMIFDASRDMFEVARNFTDFFAHESCGFCTPCRVGTSILKDAVGRIAKGVGSRSEIAEIQQVAKFLDMSHCGLGQSAARPLLGILQRFPESLTRRLASTRDAPVFDLEGALRAGHAYYGEAG